MTAFLPLMLTQEQAVEIRVMARRGESVRAIAKQLECSRNTVRRYLRDEDAQRYSPREPRACKLDEFKPYLRERVEQARPCWTLDHDGIEHGLNLRHAVCVGSRHDEGQRDATPVHQQMALAAVFSPIGWLVVSYRPRQRSLAALPQTAVLG
jgi:hypothetical protein